MKRLFSVLLLCVIFVLCPHPQNIVYASNNETIEFVFENKIFEYNLSENLKHSEIFDINYEINKYDRYDSYEKRKELLKKMKCAGFENSIIAKYLFPNIDKVMSKMKNSINISAQNAKCIIDSSTQKVFHIKPEVVGRKIDENKMYSEVLDKYFNMSSVINVDVPVEYIKPAISEDFYKKFTNLRADFSTNISSSSADRKHNIKNALQALNKIEILPNQTFSFNQVVGRRTEKNGYRKAKIIVNEEFVEGIGGGVCQVSTTLYNAVLMAGLDIVEANKHSKQVSYITPGFDAMVNFGSSDLKFKNNTAEKTHKITSSDVKYAILKLIKEHTNITINAIERGILIIPNVIKLF
ncbi:MAG: VanW family protein [Clostridia bacterium]|nr:VanW family protein [Clostridia bacterium]